MVGECDPTKAWEGGAGGGPGGKAMPEGIQALVPVRKTLWWKLYHGGHGGGHTDVGGKSYNKIN